MTTIGKVAIASLVAAVLFLGRELLSVRHELSMLRADFEVHAEAQARHEKSMDDIIYSPDGEYRFVQRQSMGPRRADSN